MPLKTQFGPVAVVVGGGEGGWGLLFISYRFVMCGGYQACRFADRAGIKQVCFAFVKHFMQLTEN